jgi:hypothetical protein
MRNTKKTKSISPVLRAAVVIPALGLISFAALHAQVTSGSIVGVVYDQSGAVIPNSTVTATDVATGAAREVQTNTSGYYAILSPPPDPYKVAASAAGFAVTNAQIVVALGQAANFDFHLNPGNTSQNVEVNAGNSQLELETTDHQVGTLVPSHNIENLPANGRNVFQTLQAATNVAPFQNAAGPVSNFKTTSNSLTIGGSASVYTGAPKVGALATNARYKIVAEHETQTVMVNQQQGAGQWHLLGTFDNPRFVELSNAANGIVVADAVRFERIE